MYSVAISDGVLPGNTGAGHILKRLIRNAAYRSGRLLGSHAVTGILPELSRTVVAQLSPAFPELEANLPIIIDTVSREEKAFCKTLTSASSKLAKRILRTNGDLKTSDMFMFTTSCH